MNQTGRDNSDARLARFRRDGFLAPVGIMATADAATHRARMERAESAFGDLHY